MAWPYSGVWTGNASKLATIIASLCRAVNERREAQANSAIDFSYTDDLTAETPYPTAAQFTANGVQIDGPCTRANLVLLQAQVTAMANSGSFYETDAFTTAWTLTSLLADVGLGASLTVPATSLLSVEWVKLRECLDRLIYFRIGMGDIGVISQTGKSSDLYDKGIYPDTFQEAWDHRDDNGSPETLDRVEWLVDAVGSQIYVTITDAVTKRFYTSRFSGSTLVKAELTVHRDVSMFTYDGEWQMMEGFDIDVGGVTVLAGTSESPITIDCASATIIANTDITMEITTEEPTPAPFDDFPNFGSLYQFTSLEMDGLTIYLDFTPVLTDQS